MAIENIREYFESILPGKLSEKPDLSEKINATYKFAITGDESTNWVIDFTAGGAVSEADGDAACTITVNGSDFLDIINGKLNGQMAFMTGKLKVAGDMGLAMKLGSFLG